MKLRSFSVMRTLGEIVLLGGNPLRLSGESMPVGIGVCFVLLAFRGFICEGGGVRAASFAGTRWRAAFYPRRRSSVPLFAVSQPGMKMMAAPLTFFRQIRRGPWVGVLRRCSDEGLSAGN